MKHWIWIVLCCAFAAGPTLAQDAAALRARYDELRPALSNNAFQRPLVLESSETPERLRGDIYARIEQPFAVVGQALRGSNRWCDILMLHINVKQCRAAASPSGTTLGLAISSKFDQALDDAYQFDFAYQLMASRPDYLQLMLHADEGPLGTSAYRIVLEIVPLEGGRSFLHMSYAYQYGLAARVAMQAYLATAGRNKVGFSVVGRQADGTPAHIGGVRGVIERNTMRYYLAIEAYLGALDTPVPQQLAKRLNDWHTGTERYPRQLHELERDQYLELKRNEFQRQQSVGG